ncbi:hypothetical protein A2U01_0088072, partial [Trifolium medium]|nr:hypothetical protein [Trifolium medium]
DVQDPNFGCLSFSRTSS